MNSTFLSIALLLSLPGAAYATNDDQALKDVAPPKAPFVSRAPDTSTWIITITPSDKGPLAPNLDPALPLKYLKQQTWVKAGHVMRCVNDWTDGTQTEDWIAAGTKFNRSPQDGGLRIFSPQSDASYHDFNKSDFEMMDWITSAEYVHAVNHSGTPCYLFVAKTIVKPGWSFSGPHNKTVAELAAPTSHTSVFVSIQTGLPVELDNGDGQFIYHFQAAPAPELTLPEPIASMAKAMAGR